MAGLHGNDNHIQLCSALKSQFYIVNEQNKIVLFHFIVCPLLVLSRIEPWILSSCIYCLYTISPILPVSMWISSGKPTVGKLLKGSPRGKHRTTLQDIRLNVLFSGKSYERVYKTFH